MHSNSCRNWSTLTGEGWRGEAGGGRGEGGGGRGEGFSWYPTQN